MNPTRDELERLGCKITAYGARDIRDNFVAFLVFGVAPVYGKPFSELSWRWKWDGSVLNRTYRPRFRVKAKGVE
jgi:hypothetical protein